MRQQRIPELAERLERGEYVIDSRAVADAMVRRHADRDEALRLSRVLVSGQVDRTSALVEEPEARARPDAA